MATQDEPENCNGWPNEFALIEELFAPLAAASDGAYALKDDAALFSPSPGHEIVLTVDAIVAGVHFFPDDPPGGIARKLLRVNLSDLAAKGATPRGYLLVTAWERDTPFEWMREFAKGLEADQLRFGVSLWGGDTVTTSGPLTFSLTAVGEVPTGQMIRRGGAEVGDGLYVTGTVGDAALGLMVLSGRLKGLDADHASHLAKRYREPEPRVLLGPRLCGTATASLDVSDGLMADLEHICDVSGLGARIDTNLLPLSEAGRAAVAMTPGLIEQIVSGGDDYEILFTAPLDKAAALEALARETGVPVTRIGMMTERRDGVTAVDAAGNPVRLKQLGYLHF